MKVDEKKQEGPAKAAQTWIFADFDGSSGRRIAYAFDAGRILWDVFDVEMLKMQYQKIKEENEHLQSQNEGLRQELQAAQACQSDPEPVVELRTISRAKAKSEIAKFFKQHHGEVIYPSDVAEALSLNYLLVEEIIEELTDEGKIERASG